MQKKISIPIIILIVIILFMMVNFIGDSRYVKQETPTLPSIPVNKGIFCGAPGETDPSKCVDTRP